MASTLVVVPNVATPTPGEAVVGALVAPIVVYAAIGFPFERDPGRQPEQVLSNADPAAGWPGRPAARPEFPRVSLRDELTTHRIQTPSVEPIRRLNEW